jgi:ABC-2 type transport system permease protein
MKKILAVARWEYVEKVRTKTFLIGLLLTPLIMIGMGILPSILATQADTKTKAVGIIDRTGEIGAAFVERMQSRYTLPDKTPNYLVQLLGSGPQGSLEEQVARADGMVRDGVIEGYGVVVGTTIGDTTFEYRSLAVGDFMLQSRFEETLRNVVAERRARLRGINAELLRELRVKLDMKTTKLSKTGEKEEEGDFLTTFFSAYVFMMMLFMLIVGSGQALVRSVIEEKSNRIVEVLVSSCSPTELMAGKVLGLSGLGFTQIGFWALLGVAATVQLGINIVAPANGLILIIYFILGYLLYAGIFIAAGSPLTTEQAAQQVTSYLVLILIIPIVLAFPAMKSPDALWIRVLTFIPVLTPTMMALRIPIQTPALWEIVSTMILMVLSIWGVMVAAGRIFRIGILMTGKAPTLADLLRWIKTG